MTPQATHKSGRINVRANAELPSAVEPLERSSGSLISRSGVASPNSITARCYVRTHNVISSMQQERQRFANCPTSSFAHGARARCVSLGRGSIQCAITLAIWLPGTIPLWFVWDFASATASPTWLHATVLVVALFYVAEIPWIHSKLAPLPS